MLSTVVLPAPLGPIKAVMRPGSAVRATSVAARTPPKAMLRPSTVEGLALTPGRQKSVQREIGAICAVALSMRREARFKRADDAFGRQPKHQQQQRAERQQAVLGERGDQLGQHDDDGGADHRASV